MSSIKYIYVAGPMTGSGNPYGNVHDGIVAGQTLLSVGFIPYVPHLTALWGIVYPSNTWEQWLRLDEEWLRKCDALLRLPGESKGADREVKFCEEHGIPVRHSIDQLIELREGTEQYAKNVDMARKCGATLLIDEPCPGT